MVPPLKRAPGNRGFFFGMVDKNRVPRQDKLVKRKRSGPERWTSVAESKQGKRKVPQMRDFFIGD